MHACMQTVVHICTYIYMYIYLSYMHMSVLSCLVSVSVSVSVSVCLSVCLSLSLSRSLSLSVCLYVCVFIIRVSDRAERAGSPGIAVTPSAVFPLAAIVPSPAWHRRARKQRSSARRRVHTARRRRQPPRAADIALLAAHHARPNYRELTMGKRGGGGRHREDYGSYSASWDSKSGWDPKDKAKGWTWWRGTWSPRGGRSQDLRYDQVEVRTDTKTTAQEEERDSGSLPIPANSIQKALTAAKKQDQRVRRILEEQQRRKQQWQQYKEDTMRKFAKQQAAYEQDMARLDGEHAEAIEAGHVAAAQVKALVAGQQPTTLPATAVDPAKAWQDLWTQVQAPAPASGFLQEAFTAAGMAFRDVDMTGERAVPRPPVSSIGQFSSEVHAGMAPAPLQAARHGAPHAASSRETGFLIDPAFGPVPVREAANGVPQTGSAPTSTLEAAYHIGQTLLGSVPVTTTGEFSAQAAPSGGDTYAGHVPYPYSPGMHVTKVGATMEISPTTSAKPAAGKRIAKPRTPPVPAKANGPSLEAKLNAKRASELSTALLTTGMGDISRAPATAGQQGQPAPDMPDGSSAHDLGGPAPVEPGRPPGLTSVVHLADDDDLSDLDPPGDMQGME